MPFYYYFFLLIALTIILIIIRSLVLRRNTVSVELYSKALQHENNGHFKEALISYESALNEVRKIRLHGGFKKKIIEKITLLHTVIEHNDSFRFIR